MLAIKTLERMFGYTSASESLDKAQASQEEPKIIQYAEVEVKQNINDPRAAEDKSEADLNVPPLSFALQHREENVILVSRKGNKKQNSAVAWFTKLAAAPAPTLSKGISTATVEITDPLTLQ